MKKKIRRLRLERETLRDLTSEQLEGVGGGTNCPTPFQEVTLHNSCDFGETRPCSLCHSCIQFESVCC